MNIYVLQDDRVGYELLYVENDNISCKEFQELCKELANQYGKDIYVIRDQLIKRGFSVANIKCVYTIKKD